MPDIIIIAVVAAIVAVGAYVSVKRFRKGSACCGDISEGEKPVKVTDRDRSHYPYSVTLKIEGMTCDNCRVRVENALNSIDGIWAKVDRSSGKAEVLMKTEIEPRTLCRSVAKAGYTAKRLDK